MDEVSCLPDDKWENHPKIQAGGVLRKLCNFVL